MFSYFSSSLDCVAPINTGAACFGKSVPLSPPSCDKTTRGNVDGKAAKRGNGESYTEREDIVESGEFEEYVMEIVGVMHEAEERTLPDPYYMHSQTELTWQMREALIIWLIQVHSEYDLRPETLFLNINIMDRICSTRLVTKDQYQLLGIAALWVAAKYEENHGRVPSLKNLSFICMHRYREKDFVRTERLILKTLEFDLNYPTCESFLRSHCKFLCHVGPETRAVARYLMELGLVAPNGFFVGKRSSMIATASLVLAEMIMGNGGMYPLAPRSQKDIEVIDCINVLAQCAGKPCDVIRFKYAEQRYCCASDIVQSWILRTRTASFQPTIHPPPGLLTPPKEPVACDYHSASATAAVRV
ncbi:uncharacterized protein SPPG_01522 [Spizellomyces punctatus DAOM BR117]|uniref:Cyclin N-terminal domain-containing protein n=1 Tax=Spizellomyces punctatus (strain DAOM BR117) TaxID=645134 RepID=A0A0L0HT72_SPIPD|nr:uncharacterized protein SPPG_01522 [Spizellomyces punctatus DAOM BR117]KND04080.1 hypothetical protein SPPG_01522 [Spizellomyces punctatus DAOM BR117]|eukprot:XP_016612119.1 hypothetical protein SPPG_01522 [Spizellomyces punctatus DAOM BR117]